jgi:hypothetical protein
MSRGRIRYTSHGEEFFLGDKQVSREEFEAVFRPKEIGTTRGQTASCWPLKSEALACHPGQITEIIERNRRHGVTGVSYNKDGTAILADRGARRDLMALEGVHDKSGGYGDDHSKSSPIYSEESNDYV